MKKSIVYLIATTLFLQSCAKVFYAPDARYLANTHKIIAIISPEVSIAARRKVDAAALIEQQKTESINFQRETYSWMLKRKMQGKIFVDIQDLETTNSNCSRFNSHCKCLYSLNANINNAKKRTSATFLDLGKPDIHNRYYNYPHP